MLYTKQKAFTLVELIVVVTILAILATIGFVSYSSYLTGVRDTNRIAQLTSISDGLNLYSTKNSLPIPDDNIEVSLSGSLMAYQGTAGANTLETIDFTKGGKDPRDDVYFSYYLTKDRKHFQLMAFLEESESISSLNLLTPSVHALDYTDRIPTVNGRKLGILTDESNTPIEQLGSDVDVGTTAVNYKAHLTSGDIITGTSQVLYIINPTATCKRIKEMKGSSQSGTYTINPLGGIGFKVYCEMDSEGGGWTLVHKTTTTSSGLTGLLNTTEGSPDWDSNNEYRLSIDYWKLLSTKGAMAKNIRIDGLEWDDMTEGVINSIDDVSIDFSADDQHFIFNTALFSGFVATAPSGVYYWYKNGSNVSQYFRVVKLTDVAVYGATNQPVVIASAASTTESAIEGAGGTADASYHVLSKLGIFIK